MLIIPAIDIKDGCVVRLTQGKFDENKKVYSNDPVAMAEHWQAQGAQFLHIVDLDGAATGLPRNFTTVKKLVKMLHIPIEFGGGVRTLETMKVLLEAGVSRVVLGTSAVEDRKLLSAAFAQFGQKIIVSIDAKDGKLQTKGWQETSSVEAVAFARELKAIGFKEVIYTDTSRDGTLQGPNTESIRALLEQARIKVVASGGVSSIKDLFSLKKLEGYGVTGVIIGKALYEHKISLAEALTI